MDETAAHVTALSENKLIRRLIKIVAELDLDHRDFVIFGSGPLLAHGLRRRIGDLDVVARGPAWHSSFFSAFTFDIIIPLSSIYLHVL